MKLMAFFRGIHEGQKQFGEDISFLVNLILLSAVYFTGVMFSSLTAKIFRKNFLALKPQKDKESYWKELNLKKTKTEDYYRQF